MLRESVFLVSVFSLSLWFFSILYAKEIGRSTGLEPATFGSTIQRSNQLSYDRRKNLKYYLKEGLFVKV